MIAIKREPCGCSYYEQYGGKVYVGYCDIHFEEDMRENPCKSKS